MNLATTESGTVSIILVIALVTLVTRWGGVYVMSFIPIRHRVKLFIEAMSGSVLVALITPMAINGSLASQAALGATAISMLLFKRPLLAISCGVITAALIRQFYGF